MVCANVTVASDNLVECEEIFTLELFLDTIKDSLSVGNNSTLITLKDSDGNYTIKMLLLRLIRGRSKQKPIGQAIMHNVCAKELNRGYNWSGHSLTA